MLLQAPQIETAFPHSWSVEVLTKAPLIAPARSFVYPHPVPGEEDALARGALQLFIRPSAGSHFLATCALGFEAPTVPTGVWSHPNPDTLCAVAGGYAYLINTHAPESCVHLQLRPVVAVRPIPSHGLLLFVGFHGIQAWAASGIAWATPRLSWEGLTLGDLDGDTLHGIAWDLPTDKEVPFAIDLRTGKHTGGSAPKGFS
jgi:hypothetical protein